MNKGAITIIILSIIGIFLYLLWAIDQPNSFQDEVCFRYNEIGQLIQDKTFKEAKCGELEIVKNIISKQ